LDRLVRGGDAPNRRGRPEGGVVAYDEGNHVCNNLPYLYRPLAADWIGEQLRSL